MTHSPNACSAPSELAWLTVDLMNGSVEPNAAQNVTLTIDTMNLSAGMYTATLCVESNDPNDLLIEVPISLTVLQNHIYLPIIFDE